MHNSFQAAVMIKLKERLCTIFFLAFLGAFEKKCRKRLLASSCLSLCSPTVPHGTARFPLGGFSCDLIFEYFSKNLLRKFNFY